MVGIIIELAFSWLILWYMEKRGLEAIGVLPTKSRFLYFVAGLGIAASFCAIYFYLQTVLSNYQWSVNESYSFFNGLSGFWWTIKSVLFEELIFRGALLYIAIKRIGVRKACIFSALCFGAYHWFTMGGFGNIVQMVFIFTLTGIWGLMFAYAFAATESLYLPVGIHLGWNLVNIVVFSQGPLGNQFLIPGEGTPIGTALSLFILGFQVFAIPVIVYFLFIKRSSIMKMEAAVPE